MKPKRIVTSILMIIVSLMLTTTLTLATQGSIDSDTVADDKDSVDPTVTGDCRVSDVDGDSWEATLYYKGAPQGSALLCGPTALKNAGSSIDILTTTPWTDSKGQAPLVVGTVSTTGARAFPKVPKWKDSDAFKGYGTDVERMMNQILEPIKDRGGCDEFDKIVEMLTKVPTMSEEEIQEKLDSGEYFPFFVSFRPVLL